MIWLGGRLVAEEVLAVAVVGQGREPKDLGQLGKVGESGGPDREVVHPSISLRRRLWRGVGRHGGPLPRSDPGASER